uniref:Uncharacterized protein n=1 Tax=Arundo donax TaxID=35708 RepID=A0A0A8Z7E9_ARUDO
MVPGDAPREGHEGAVVDREHDDKSEALQTQERRGWHEEARGRAEAPVQCAGLLGEQSEVLRSDGGVDHAAKPYWEQLNDESFIRFSI